MTGVLPDVRATLVGPVYAIDPTGRRCALWTTNYWTPRRWEFLDCNAGHQVSRSCLSLLEALVQGDTAVLMRGQIAPVAEMLLRFYDIIKSSSRGLSRRRELFSHCLVGLSHGKTVNISGIDAPKTSVLSELKTILDSSYDVPTYAPAHIVWSLYTKALEQLETPLDIRTQQHFRREVVDYSEPILGSRLRILPLVFIPDPGVLDLLLSAYFSPDSVLMNDILGSALIEPCTGSGILGIAAVMLGAHHVVSTDVDLSSVECARQNSKRLGFERQISVELIDGIPEHGFYDVLLTNPPWYDRDEENSLLYRRCLEDPGRRILCKILKQAALRRARIAYVFFGSDDPFAAERLTGGEWTTDRRWGSPHGVRLQRLVRET